MPGSGGCLARREGVEPLSRLFIVGAVTVWTSLTLLIVGFATPNWMEGHVEDMTFSLGLFETCENSDCVALSSFSGGLPAVMVFVVLGILCGLVAAVDVVWIFVLKQCREVTYPKKQLKICLRICGAACVLILIGLFVYMGQVYEEVRGVAPTLGYSFILSTFTCIMFPVGGVFVFIGGKPPTKARDLENEVGLHLTPLNAADVTDTS